MELTNGDRNSESSLCRQEDEELQLQWRPIERLPTFTGIRTSLFDVDHESKNEKTGNETEGKSETDITELGPVERHLFIEKLIKHVENDNLQLLQKIRERINRVNVELPTVEVRYKNFSVEAECQVVQGKPIPTLWNSVVGSLSAIARAIKIQTQGASIDILKDVSGIIKPSRLTLLLGPPGCGKTTLLLALSGQLDQSLKITGDISYNGCSPDEFVPQKNSAYISQYDLHIPEMTVRETIDFSARCQGVGSRADIMKEISKREKEAGIVPDQDIDTYMKANSVEGQKQNLQTDYFLKILGLDICTDNMVGSALRRGISGGQRKRLTTGEMIVGPKRALFMDEISNGLDSSTTFQIVTCIQQLVHITDITALISLLQPAPETFELFDDIILMAEGKIIYHGPRSDVLQFFQDCGFKCPERKNVADFLQEVTSKKDQAQYWRHTDTPYNYVSAYQFSELFKASYLGEKMKEELSKPYDRSKYHQNALSFRKYSLGKWEILKACMGRELLLMKQNSYVYVFKTAQLIITAFITTTLFIRDGTKVDSTSANYLMAFTFYAVLRLVYNGFAELALTVLRLPIVHKQRSSCLYPIWAYSIPASILKIPLSLADSFLWTAITYYVIGYSPEIQRFFYQFLLLFAVSLASSSLWRFLASVFQTMVFAGTVASLVIALMYFFGGFILPQTSLPIWLRWAFWLYPVSYAEIGASVNEFLAPRWQEGNKTIGKDVLSKHGLNFNGYFYWISLGALIGFALLMDFGFILALTYLKPPRMSRALISKKMLSQLHERKAEKKSRNADDNSKHPSFPQSTAEKRKMILPFQPLTVAFKEVQYFVDAPQEMKKSGFNKKKLQLLHNITGAFRPGILTALMGVSGAGKTTLMDVLSGRKTIGTIEGDIRIGGYPKVQKTFARISGYCEQNDIHSPQITVEESVIYSAWLRLPSEIDSNTRARFVEEVIETVELDDIKDSLVGIPGQSGLSTEQRKRLTIAVELVSNPSFIFMDEPTSGLDARAAAIVMRAVKNVVSTGRTVVCTIHQPSIDVFETFDELMLMKLGGKIIYSGKLGHRSSKLIEYFEGISGVPKINDNHNPATWMLDVTSASMEEKLGLDFARLYKESALYTNTVELVRQLSEPQAGSRDLYFPTTFAQSSWTQFKACLWKQNLSYWRSPEYNLARFLIMIFVSLMIVAIFWQKAQEVNNEQDLFTILGSMYCVLILVGIHNCATILPYVATERTVLYRETFAGMYSSWNYSFAQVAIEIPYVLLQTIIYTALTYPAMGYEWSALKLFGYLYTAFCTFLYFVYLGMLIASISPTLEVASIIAAAIYPILNLFAGFLLPGPKMPKWWVWCYWLCPTSWSLNGFLTVQYGDMEKEISAYGEMKTVSSFLQDYYGFHYDQLGLVAALLIAFPVVYASLYAYFIGKLNFQKR